MFLKKDHILTLAFHINGYTMNDLHLQVDILVSGFSLNFRKSGFPPLLTTAQQVDRRPSVDNNK